MKHNTTNKKRQNGIIRSMMVLALCLISSLSCNKSSEEAPQLPNEMEVNGQTYQLDGGVLIDWAEVNNGAADYDIALFTEGIVINEEGQPENAGSLILFDMNSYSASDFAGGAFTFSNERGPGTISGAYVVTDYNGDPSSIPNAIYMASGTVNVNVGIDSDGYELNFSLTTINGGTVTGYYSGDLIKQTND